MINAFTVDVEDYFQVESFAGVIDRNAWGDYAPRVERNTQALLDLLEAAGIKGTFFILGWVAKRQPALVKEIAARGHEVASHGMSHKLVYRQSPEEFRSETLEGKRLLEDLVQRPVVGYRAATYSIVEKSLWAMDVLAEAGFLYDSSIFPIRHDRYGIPGAPLEPYVHRTPGGNRIVEFPLSVLRAGAATIPVAGGGYFRLFPYAFTRWALGRLNRRGVEFVFYVHPWEVDPAQPRVDGAPLASRFRHYLNLDRCEARLARLTKDFRFAPMRAVLERKGLIGA